MEQPLSPKEKIAFDKVNESIRFDGERYEVDVPWKHERPEFITWHMKIIYVNSGVKNYMKIIAERYTGIAEVNGSNPVQA